MATLTLRPNATVANPSTHASTVVSFSLYPNTGESAYEDIDEVISDDDTTYLQASNTHNQSGVDLGLPNHTTETGTINSVKVYGIVRNTNARFDKTVIFGVYIGSTYSDSNPEYIGSTSYVSKSATWTTNPDTEIAWTWDNIDDLQVVLQISFGALGRGGEGYGRCTQLYVEVDYEEATGTATQLYTITDGLNQFTCEQ